MKDLTCSVSREDNSGMNEHVEGGEGEVKGKLSSLAVPLVSRTL